MPPNRITEVETQLPSACILAIPMLCACAYLTPVRNDNKQKIAAVID